MFIGLVAPMKEKILLNVRATMEGSLIRLFSIFIVIFDIFLTIFYSFFIYYLQHGFNFVSRVFHYSYVVKFFLFSDRFFKEFLINFIMVMRILLSVCTISVFSSFLLLHDMRNSLVMRVFLVFNFCEFLWYCFIEMCFQYGIKGIVIVVNWFVWFYDFTPVNIS